MIKTENKDLYPTPESVIEMMVNKMDIAYCSRILEPSAGIGNIVKYLKKESWKGLTIDAIEPEKDYHPLLKSLGANVVAEDFLTYNTFTVYDCIIMNPPFSSGDKHLLKAIDIMKNGGKICCLLNSETINNPYSKYRKYLLNKLEELNAEIIELGQCFMNSERPTNVNVSMIYIDIPVSESDIIDNLKKEKEIEFEYKDNTEITDRRLDVFSGIVEQYELEVKSILKLIDEYYNIVIKSNGEPVLELTTKKFKDKVIDINRSSLSEFKNYIIKEIRYKYWENIFERSELTTSMTRQMLIDYRSKIKELSNIEFNISNIKQIQIDIVNHLVNSVEESILKFFDDVTNIYAFYNEEKTIRYYKGWKANKVGIIDKKVILPIDAFYNSTHTFNPTHFEIESSICDIHKVFSYFEDGNILDSSSIRTTLKAAKDNGQYKKIEFDYFYIDFFKRGTMHIKFKRPDIVKRINIYCGKKLNALPISYGNKRYKDMTDDEKRIIDDFEGKESYDEIMNNPKKYMLNTNQMLAITTTNE